MDLHCWLLLLVGAWTAISHGAGAWLPSLRRRRRG